MLALVVGSAQGAECTKLVFSANPDYPPFHWSDRGKLMGASIELTQRIFDELGVNAVPQYVGPWARVLRAASQGQIDLVTALKPSPEREAFLAFTPARFYSNPMAIFVRTDQRFPYAGRDDLAGRTGLVARGDRFGEGFDEFLAQKVKVMTDHNMEQGFASLRLRRADFFVTGYYPGTAFLTSRGLAGEVMALTPFINQGSVHHGFVRSSPCLALMGRVSEKLRAYEADGTTERLMAKYMDLWRSSAAARVE